MTAISNIDTSMYYTFSTIAQSLAGFLALSGVFVLYQIQRYSHIQSVLVDAYIREVDSKYKILPKFFEDKKIQSEFGDFTEIANGLIEFSCHPEIAPLKEVVKLSKGCATDLRFIQTKKKTLLILTKIAIIVGVLVIIYSFLILANVPTIVLSYNSFISYLFAYGIVSAIMSIFFMLLGIIISLKK